MLVDGKQNFFRPPVKLRVVVGRKGKDHGSDARFFSLAHEIEIQHTLDSLWHEAVDDAPGLGGKVFDLVVCLVIGDLAVEGLDPFHLRVVGRG